MTKKREIVKMAKRIRKECAIKGIALDFITSLKLAKCIITTDFDRWEEFGGSTESKYSHPFGWEEESDTMYQVHSYCGVELA